MRTIIGIMWELLSGSTPSFSTHRLVLTRSFLGGPCLGRLVSAILPLPQERPRMAEVFRGLLRFVLEVWDAGTTVDDMGVSKNQGPEYGLQRVGLLL